jgi:chloramphenicol-sensitive protein RarD
VWYGVAAYIVWGLSPLFWNLVDGVDASALLIHRILWALPMLAIAITVRRQWATLRSDYAVPYAKASTIAAALLLATNWGLFLWAVTNEQVVEASLGYFINPFVSVALGVIVLGERLRRLQWTAVAIAAVGVTGLALRVGSVPWVSLGLALSFGLYGLLKKRPETPRPLDSLFGEVAVVAAPAFLFLLVLDGGGSEGIGSSFGTTAFLISTGAITVIPLLLFGAAAKRIPLSTIGVLQYIAPTLQFLIGVLVFAEELTAPKLFAFAMVWLALGVYTYDNVRTTRMRQPTAA